MSFANTPVQLIEQRLCVLQIRQIEPLSKPTMDWCQHIMGFSRTTGIAPKTITGWLARGGPARNPFPVPDRLLYRVYWRRTEIESWQTRETVADSQPRTRLNGE